MPQSDMKVKSGNSYKVAYCVEGSLTDLTREQLEVLALKQIRSASRNMVVAALNEAEPAILVNRQLFADMIDAELGTPESVEKFFVKKGLYREIPTEFHIPISKLTEESSGRGKKASDPFSLTSEDDDTDETPEAAVGEVTPPAAE